MNAHKRNTGISLTTHSVFEFGNYRRATALLLALRLKVGKSGNRMMTTNSQLFVSDILSKLWSGFGRRRGNVMGKSSGEISEIVRRISEEI